MRFHNHRVACLGIDLLISSTVAPHEYFDQTGGGAHDLALYARSSTADPTGDLQFEELKEFVEFRGWKIADEYLDVELPGTACQQPALDKLLKHASEHRFDCIDRFSYRIQVFLERLK